MGKGMIHRMSALRRLLAVGTVMVACAAGSLTLTTTHVSAATTAPSVTAAAPADATPMTPNDWCRWHDCGGGDRDFCRWHDCRGDRDRDFCRWHDCRR
jgi:hypothetical protein